MTYKEFKQWCNERACDGEWGFFEAKTCLTIISLMEQTTIFSRRREWEKHRELAEKIVNATEAKRKEIKSKGEDK